VHRALESTAQPTLLEAPHSSDGSGRTAGCAVPCISEVKGYENVTVGVSFVYGTLAVRRTMRARVYVGLVDKLLTLMKC